MPGCGAEQTARSEPELERLSVQCYELAVQLTKLKDRIRSERASLRRVHEGWVVWVAYGVGLAASFAVFAFCLLGQLLSRKGSGPDLSYPIDYGFLVLIVVVAIANDGWKRLGNTKTRGRIAELQESARAIEADLARIDHHIGKRSTPG